MSSIESEKKVVLSTQGYRGTRDFFPEYQRLRTYVRSKMHAVLKSFGYEEYDGPIVEHLELYAAKSSEEIVREQLYSFKDKGDRTLAIRPEMTPTLARMVAQRQAQLPRPIRWYSVPTCMRFERPQRGRLREFDQLNVDIFGGHPLDEDIEIILTCVELMKSVGAPAGSFVVKMNHRGLVNAYLEHILHVPQESHPHLLRLLDKCDKITKEEFFAGCDAFHFNVQQKERLYGFLSAPISEIETQLHGVTSAAKDLGERIALINQLAGFDCAQFSPAVMRGFDYYTGLVFEVFDTHPDNRRALFGGGRYDNLVGAFGGAQLPGIGYGMGDVAMTNFMEVHGLTPVLKKECDVSVLRFSEQERASSLLLATHLRRLKLNVEAPVTLSKFGKQIQSAEKAGAKAVAFLGEEEIKQQQFSVKWLQTGAQETFANDARGRQLFYEKLQKR